MCFGDPGLMLGALSAAAGEAGKMSAASTNADIVTRQARLEHAQQERQYLIEADAANKQAYGASQERDRAVALAKIVGVDVQGSTAGDRIAEQNRQGALSIANAKDQQTGAKVNYVMAGQNSTIKAENDIKANAVNPLTSFINVAKGGLDGYGTIQTNPTPSATSTYAALK